MYSLVGYTGFVGSNLTLKHTFDGLYNTKNISDAFYTRPELLIYAGLRAEKFLANNNQQKDYQSIEEAIYNIKKINPQKLVLISTVDVYQNPINVNEDSIMETSALLPYGLHRLALEQYVEQYFNDYLIVRLPGLFGKNIKKNFIYDFINYIPSLLNETKYGELASKSKMIKSVYIKQENGFYKCFCDNKKRSDLKLEFEKVGFSALNFTDSRGVFQFYNLANLWQDINIALEHGIKKINLSTEPISIGEIYQCLTGNVFINKLTGKPPFYDIRSKYADFYGGKNGYIYGKDDIIQDIKSFVEKYTK